MKTYKGARLGSALACAIDASLSAISQLSGALLAGARVEDPRDWTAVRDAHRSCVAEAERHIWIALDQIRAWHREAGDPASTVCEAPKHLAVAERLTDESIELTSACGATLLSQDPSVLIGYLEMVGFTREAVKTTCPSCLITRGISGGL